MPHPAALGLCALHVTAPRGRSAAGASGGRGTVLVQMMSGRAEPSPSSRELGLSLPTDRDWDRATLLSQAGVRVGENMEMQQSSQSAPRGRGVQGKHGAELRA